MPATTVVEGATITLRIVADRRVVNDLVVAVWFWNSVGDAADIAVEASCSPGSGHALTMTIAAGRDSVDCRVTTVRNDDDGDGDVDDGVNFIETVQLWKVPPAGETSGLGNASTAFNIRDNNPPPPPVVSLASTALTVAESNGSGVQIIAVLNKPATRLSSVAFSASGAAHGYGSCYAGVQFYLSALSFRFGVGADRASIILYPCSDADYNDETVTVRLTSVGIVGLTLGSPTTAVVTIVDPEPPVVSISGPATVDEGVGTATFTVALSKTWTAAVSVDVDTTAGTATAGSDYTTVDRRVTIPAGQRSRVVPVTILDDTVVETDETFTVTLSNPSNATLNTSSSVQSTIGDDDAINPTDTRPGPGL